MSKIIVYASTGYVGSTAKDEIDLIECGFTQKELDEMSEETENSINEIAQNMIYEMVESGWYWKEEGE
jgi:hypothetical protein